MQLKNNPHSSIIFTHYRIPWFPILARNAVGEQVKDRKSTSNPNLWGHMVSFFQLLFCLEELLLLELRNVWYQSIARQMASQLNGEVWTSYLIHNSSSNDGRVTQHSHFIGWWFPSMSPNYIKEQERKDTPWFFKVGDPTAGLTKISDWPS